LPLVIGFYLLLSVLEDSGYLPRIAALTDRSLTAVGLNGRAIIPMILGLGCVTMGTLTTRILGSKRERFIATALMAIAVPCTAQIAVIAALMARTGALFSAAYVIFLVLVFGIVGAVLNKVLPGQSTDLLIDLPSLRLPRLDNVMRKSFTKVWHFMKEVTLFFALGALLISVMQVTGALAWVIAFASPLMIGWLGLPAEAATAFVMGFVRRDFGATGFFSMNLTDAQLLVGMITITLFVPCIASAMVIWKERGAAYFAGLFAGSIALALLVGGLVWRLLVVAGVA
jgi:ferrous iron transport protein B